MRAPSSARNSEQHAGPAALRILWHARARARYLGARAGRLPQRPAGRPRGQVPDREHKGRGPRVHRALPSQGAALQGSRGHYPERWRPGALQWSGVGNGSSKKSCWTLDRGGRAQVAGGEFPLQAGRAKIPKDFSDQILLGTCSCLPLPNWTRSAYSRSRLNPSCFPCTTPLPQAKVQAKDPYAQYGSLASSGVNIVWGNPADPSTYPAGQFEVCSGQRWHSAKSAPSSCTLPSALQLSAEGNRGASGVGRVPYCTPPIGSSPRDPPPAQHAQLHEYSNSSCHYNAPTYRLCTTTTARTWRLASR